MAEEIPVISLFRFRKIAYDNEKLATGRVSMRLTAPIVLKSL